MKNYIAIDLGATSGRVVLSSISDGGDVSMETLHRFPTPMLESGSGIFWDINIIYENILEGLKEAGRRQIKVESIGVDSWGVDFVGVKSDGSFSGNPHSYRDPYSFAAQQEFFKHMSPEELYSRTGIEIMNFNSVFQLFAQKKRGELKDVCRILFIPDAVSYMLSGKMVCEYSILSTSALMDPRTRTLDDKILSVCGLTEDMFPDIVYPGADVGLLKDDLAELTGLGQVMVKAVAGHDTASVIAAVPSENSHFAYLSSGTWSLMGVETDSPQINQRMYSLNFTNEGGVAGKTCLLKNITGMWILEQCLRKLKSAGREYSYEEIGVMAENCELSANVFDPDDPVFSAPPDMIGAIEDYMKGHGWSAPEDDAHLFRLVYDSLAARYAVVFSMLKELSPFEIEALHIVGGGSRNSFLNRLTAKACGVKVIAGPAEGTALGNVMVQAGLTRNDIGSSIKTEIYQ